MFLAHLLRIRWLLEKASGNSGCTRRERRRGSCRTKAKLGRSLALPLKPLAGSFHSAARLSATFCRLADTRTSVFFIDPDHNPPLRLLKGCSPWQTANYWKIRRQISMWTTAVNCRFASCTVTDSLSRLWVLDSGRGRLVTVDPANGQTETVAQLNGYTRALTFAGPLAFVGLSQIRETAMFGGVPIADENKERQCGVSVIDTRTGLSPQGKRPRSPPFWARESILNFCGTFWRSVLANGG